MYADLRDKTFKNQKDGKIAIFVHGMFGEPFMDQFAGVGYSTTPYTMKAILFDNQVYIPNPTYAYKTRKRNRDYSAYPMVLARIQPPVRAMTIAH